MRELKSRIAVLTLCFILIFAMTAGCGLSRVTKDKTDSNGTDPDEQQEYGELVADGEEYSMPVWIPFLIDDKPMSRLEGFLYEPTPVLSASQKEAGESGDKASRATQSVLKMAPHYPYEQVPLLEPDLLAMCKEKDTGTTVSVNVTYYTKASFDTALEFYRNILRSYNRYNETAIETDDGPWYTMKFSTTVSGGYEMDASLTVSRADESRKKKDEAEYNRPAQL